MKPNKPLENSEAPGKKKDSFLTELVLKFTYSYFTIRVWLEIDQEDFKNKSTLRDCTLVFIKALNNTEDMTDPLVIANFLMKGDDLPEGINSVEVSSNAGAVTIHKNWP